MMEPCCILGVLRLSPESVTKTGIALFRFVIADCNGERFSGANQHHQFSASGDSSIDQISLQERIVLGQNWEDDCRIF